MTRKPAMTAPTSRTAPAADHRPRGHRPPKPPVAVAFVARKRHPNEAAPPANDLWARPVYVPERDNHLGMEKRL